MDLVDDTRSGSSDGKANAEEKSHENKKDEIEKPIHKFRDPFLSSSTDYSTFKGYLNAFVMLVVFINTYLALDYFLKYGVLINPSEVIGDYFTGLIETPLVLAFLGRHLLSLFSFLLEKLLAKGILNESFGLVFIILSLTLGISIAPVVVPFINSFMVALHTTLGCQIFFLKLISYHVENYRYRNRFLAVKSEMNSTALNQSKQSGIEDEHSNMIRYPDNLNIKNFYYFLYVPTLCYELNFPRTPKIRKEFLIKRLLEVLFLFTLFMVHLQQTGVPLALEYQDYYQGDSDYVRFASISIKFTEIYLFGMVLAHYIIYHAWLNALSEMMRFGDRKFYGDWWNSCNMKDFWAGWNTTLHEWGIRYLFIPLLNRGFSKVQAISAVFFVSGLFYEYLFSLYLTTYRMPYFLFMLGQIPFVIFGSTQANNQFGNVAVWAIVVLFLNCLLTEYLPAIRMPSALKNRTAL